MLIYLPVASELYECLIQVSCVQALLRELLVSSASGKAPVRAAAGRGRRLAGQPVRSVAGLQGRRMLAGERMCELQVSDMSITDDAPAERPHYYHGKYRGNKGTILRTEGYLLLLIGYF